MDSRARGIAMRTPTVRSEFENSRTGMRRESLRRVVHNRSTTVKAFVRPERPIVVS
jgi:hypothetical protein